MGRSVHGTCGTQPKIQRDERGTTREATRQLYGDAETDDRGDGGHK